MLVWVRECKGARLNDAARGPGSGGPVAWSFPRTHAWWSAGSAPARRDLL